jgi:hypothetical protein
MSTATTITGITTAMIGNAVDAPKSVWSVSPRLPAPGVLVVEVPCSEGVLGELVKLKFGVIKDVVLEVDVVDVLKVDVLEVDVLEVDVLVLVVVDVAVGSSNNSTVVRSVIAMTPVTTLLIPGTMLIAFARSAAKSPPLTALTRVACTVVAELVGTVIV